MKIALVGNPNSGKTTLFNHLTQGRQKVGNWAGVTVDCHVGHWQGHDVVDLPGIYSLDDCDIAVDTQICKGFVARQDYDVLINIIDASQLERHLYLTTQLLELGKPVIIILTMLDIASKQGKTIDIKQLSSALGCPVLTELKHLPPVAPARAIIDWPQAVIRGDEMIENEPREIIIAECRYAFTHNITTNVTQQKSELKPLLTDKIDRWVLDKYLGIPLFFAVMYGLFFVTMSVGGWLQDRVEVWADWLLVEQASLWVPSWIANGLGRGMSTTLSFIPIIGAMFFCLSALEASGYMARAAFVMDRFMRALGLPGKSFVPMIVGFGCNVPAIMAARTLNNPRDRILTILMMPFMSCTARLAIFAVIAAAFFPGNAHNVIFILYLIGISCAVLTGYLLRRTVLVGKPAPYILELPSYHKPVLKNLIQQSIRRVNSFLTRASKIIIPVCLILAILDDYNLLNALGQMMTPLFYPMGLEQQNWPAAVGLLTGMFAKEVVIASLNTLYTQSNMTLVTAFGSAASAFAYLLFILLYIPCVSTMAVIRKELNTRWMLLSCLWCCVLAYSLAVLAYQVLHWGGL